MDDHELDHGDPVGDNMVIVSVDTHVGPRVREDLRPYCPTGHLDDLDDFAGRVAELKEVVAGVADFLVKHPNFEGDDDDRLEDPRTWRPVRDREF